MTDIDLIVKHLPQDLHEIAQSYNIPDEFLKSMPQLIELVLRSKSMEKPEEKQSWFNLLPMMNDQQINKLNGILTKEKVKLQEIEDKYNKKKEDIKNKYNKRWEQMWYNKHMKELKNKEKETRKKEMEEADSLLDQI